MIQPEFRRLNPNQYKTSYWHPTLKNRHTNTISPLGLHLPPNQPLTQSLASARARVPASGREPSAQPNEARETRLRPAIASERRLPAIAFATKSTDACQWTTTIMHYLTNRKQTAITIPCKSHLVQYETLLLFLTYPPTTHTYTHTHTHKHKQH